MRIAASAAAQAIALSFLIACPSSAEETFASPPELTFDQVLQLRAEVQQAEATFTQSQFLVSLTEPIISKGTMRYEAPTFVEMTVKEPRFEQFIFDGNRLEIRSGERPEVRSIRANKQSVLAVFLGALTSMLAGNQDNIDQNFTRAFSVDGEKWLLHLKPKLKKIQRRVSRVEFGGALGVVDRVSLVMKNGNQTIIRIEELP